MFATSAPILHGSIKMGVKFKPKRTLDIYYPTQEVEGKSPVILFVHGGGWVAGRKESVNMNRFNDAFNDLRGRGYTIISCEYALARKRKSPFPECIQDGFDALHWIEDNADSLNLDIQNVGIMGESAGAHISMMCAYAKPSDFGMDMPVTKLAYVIDVYGPSNLVDLYHSNTVDTINAIINKLPKKLNERLDLAQLLFGFDPTQDSVKTTEFALKYSPISYVTEDAPKTLLIHGINDRVVPIDQTRSLQEKIKCYWSKK